MGEIQLCGVYENFDDESYTTELKGTYTSEGITKGRKGSAVPSLRCAAPRSPERSFSRQRPLILSPPTRPHAVSEATNSVTRAPLRSLPSSAR